MKRTITQIIPTTVNWYRLEDSNYWISNFGEVQLREGKLSKTLRSSPAGAGYLRVFVNGKSQYVHRLLMVAYNRLTVKGFSASGMQVNHINGRRYDNRVENLEITSASCNIQHSVDNGFRKKAINKSESNNYPVFFTDDQVIKMRELYNSSGYTQIEIAKMFNTIQPTVSRIVRGVYRRAV